MIFNAAATGNLKAIAQRLADGQDIDAKARASGLTPLMAAAITGQTDAAKLLLDEGAKPNLKSDKDGATALHRQRILLGLFHQIEADEYAEHQQWVHRHFRG